MAPSVDNRWQKARTVRLTLWKLAVNPTFIEQNAQPSKNDVKSLIVHCDGAQQMIRAIDLELQSRAINRKKPNRRNAYRLYSLIGIILMITVALFALQLLTSHMHTLSGRVNASRNPEAGQR